MKKLIILCLVFLLSVVLLSSCNTPSRSLMGQPITTNTNLNYNSAGASISNSSSASTDGTNVAENPDV